jgi:hypothetical protein
VQSANKPPKLTVAFYVRKKKEETKHSYFTKIERYSLSGREGLAIHKFL